MNLKGPWSIRMHLQLAFRSSRNANAEIHLRNTHATQEDREFIEASEGLGNSQKAEVAWLERKGYAYTSVEIDVAKWTQHKVVSNPSPKVIGGDSLCMAIVKTIFT